MAPLVVSRTNDDTRALGGLLAGISFFLVQRLPSRSTFVAKVQNNGGRVVKLEAQADHVIADHMRKDSPPGSLSYTFIDVAIRDGALPDPSDHSAGPPVGAIRDVGSSVPGKQTRTAFTAEDDRALWQWVERAKEQGGLVKGNDIYKQLEARNPRHTFQAWRDRYIKKLMTKPPIGVALKVAANAPPSPPEAPDEATDARGVSIKGKQKATSPVRRRTIEQLESAARVEPAAATFRLPRGSQMVSQSPEKSGSPKLRKKPQPPDQNDEDDDVDEALSNEFDDSDYERLLGEAKDIVAIDESQYMDAWQAYAQAYTTHTADEWQEYWEDKVRPEYMRRVEERKEAKRRRTLEKEQKAKKLAAKKLAAKPRANGAKVASKHEADGAIKDDASLLPVKAEAASSQKRKRAMPTPKGAKATYSQKKHRPDVSSLFDDKEEPLGQPTVEQTPAERPRQGRQPALLISPNRTQPIEILSDSEDEEDANRHELPETKQNHADWLDDDQIARVEDAMQVDLPVPSGVPLLVDKPVMSDMLTSEAMRAADHQLCRESLGAQETMVEPPKSQLRLSNLPTSEANQAAEQQIRRESTEAEVLDVEIHTSPRQHDSNLPTSDANRAAEQQLRRESLGPDPSLDEDRTSPPRQPSHFALPGQGEDIVISNHLVEDGEVEDGLPGEELIDIDVGGDALTEANLASQQAQHKEQLLRGADLPEDDNDQDQTEYLKYLQQLTGEKAEAEAASPEGQATPKTQRVLEEAQAELPSDDLLEQTPYNGDQLPENGDKSELVTVAVPMSGEEHDDLLDQTRYTHNETELDPMDDGLTAPATLELPLSSQQEVDEVFETNLQWPSSPQASQRKAKIQLESQSMPFETQIAYPNLPSEGGEDDEQMFSSQPAQPEEVAYPALPQHSDKESINAGAYFSSQPDIRSQTELPSLATNGRTRHDEDPKKVGYGSGRQRPDGVVPGNAHSPLFEDDDNALDDSELPVFEEDEEDAGYEQEDEIDLTIPEPDGGFGFSSSPAKLVASQPPERALIDDEANEVEESINEQSESEPEAEVRQPEEETRTSNVPPQDVIDVSSASSSSSLYESSAPSCSAPDEAHAPSKAVETQDILDAETQPLDLEMPLPPDSDDESEELPFDPLAAPSPPPETVKLVKAPVFPTPRVRPTSTRPQSKTQPAPHINLAEAQTLDDDGLDDYITTMTVRYRVTEDSIAAALKSTSMRPELAELVLLEEKAGRGLPIDVPGVWTEAEDQIIESGDARGMRGVTEKHGWDEMESRLKFLEQWRSG
ncbi:hypothetical protein LTR85_001067 [Meristemomyces frigidus]|nr:hypothetical protein LTR85_001067 [Meristemomyces frigidus]